MQKIKTQKGITLIALIITIIVMLILVGVTITVSINGGLFSQARKAGNKTQIAAEMEILQSAALLSIGTDGKVNFRELDKNLPEMFTKVGEKTYAVNADTDSERAYIVSDYGDVEEEGPVQLRVEINYDYGTPRLIISLNMKELTEENITDRYTIDIIEYSFFNETTGIETYEDLYEKCARALTGNAGLTYKDLEDGLKAGGNTNPTTQDVFLYLMSQAAQMPDMEVLAEVKTPQQLAVSSFVPQMYTNLYIYDGDKERYEDEDEYREWVDEGVEIPPFRPIGEFSYTVPAYGEYNITVNNGGLEKTVKVKVEPEKDDLGFDVKISETGKLQLLISYNSIPSNEETKRLTINGEDKTSIMGGYNNKAQYNIPSYGKYEVVLEVYGKQETKTVEIPEPILNLNAELSEPFPLKLLISYDEMPEIYAKRTKLYINDEDKTTIVDKNKLEYILPTYKTYEVVLEVEGITTKTKTAEITGQEITEILNWDTSKIDIRREEDGRAVPIPKGFEVLTTAAKPQGYTIDEGLVITNGGNEFVWVPVTSPGEFTEDSFGPIEETLEIDGENVKTDSYKTIQYYYGNALGTMNSDADFDAVFTYEADRENVERSIRTYGGFYVGRYETTYDSLSNGVPQGIGVKKGKDVLVANSLLKPGTDTKPASGTNYFYRWWGLYKVQKDMYAENSNVGSLMISGPQWYAIMKYTQYEYAIRSKNTYTNLDENGEVTVQDKSGSAYNGNPNQYDEAKNIYDLAGNVNEWTINQYSGKGRGACGGNCFYPAYASVWGSHAPTLVHVYPRF